MGLRAFLRKERYASRRNLAVLVLLLVVLPGAAAFGTTAFQHSLPENVPIGIAPQDETVTEDELGVVSGGVATQATPKTYDSTADARHALSREEVYLVIEVPPDLFDEEANATVTVVSDQRLVTFQEPSELIVAAIDDQLDRQLPATIDAEHERIGDDYSLSEYLIPTGLLTIVVLFTFLYLPFEVRQERAVFERVALTSRIEAAVGAKLVHYGVLMVVPLSTFQLVSLYLGYDVSHFTVDTFAVLGVTVVALAATSTAVMFAFRLRRIGLFVNLALLTGTVVFSGLVYPVGFFSLLRLRIVRSLPTHYAMIITRSTMTKDASLVLFADWMVGLVGCAVLAVLALQASIVYYRRTM